MQPCFHSFKSAAQARTNEILKKYLRGLVKNTLGLPSQQILNDEQGFFDIGMDSLMAVEFKNQLQAEIGSSYVLPATLAMDFPTVNTMADYLQRLIYPEEKKAAVEDKNEEKKMQIEKEVQSLSLEELYKKLE